MDVSASETQQLLELFNKVQQHRATLYSRFHAGFKKFLDSKQEPRYRQLMTEITEGFNVCSKDVIDIEKALHECQRSDLAALLRTIQGHEREKLRLTLSLQALRQALAFKTFSWQHREVDPLAGPGEEDDPHGPASEESAAGMAMLHGHMADHQHQHHHSGCGCGHGSGMKEATEAEYNAAVNEAMHLLDQAVHNINDALEEVRYALEELQEDG